MAHPQETTTQKVVNALLGHKRKIEEIDILWIKDFLGCDGDTVSVTAARRPALEDVLMGQIPGLPKVNLHNGVLAYENGEAFMEPFRKAARDELGRPFILVIEGSIPNEKIKKEGYWAAFGVDEKGEPIPSTWWIDQLAPKAWAVVACGTCATYGGIHAMGGNPTGAMGLLDYLGRTFLSRGGYPIINVPGCPVQPDNFMETLAYCLYMAAGLAPVIPLDVEHRPTWLFGFTVHEGCDRGSFYEEANFAEKYGQVECLVKLGCWGPVINCNVPKRGWMDGIGGCPNVGGICMACTMPGFPDKFMPFMDAPPGSALSSKAVFLYGKVMKTLRRWTQRNANREPNWRHPRPELTTGYDPRTWRRGQGGEPEHRTI
ncbi:MAG TPA: hydrogenase expression protein HypE [Planctomycetota bacterium]|nr:hydrogenase expression protein HypE [Planctomycetota bacterium]